MAQPDTDRLRALFARVRAAGFDDVQVARWYGVPRVTDARWATPSAERTRRGVGGWIALWVAGEAVEAASLAPLPSADERAALVALGLAEDDGTTLRARARVMPWRGLVVASPPAEQFDLSAINVAASLPPLGAPAGDGSGPATARRMWDVGCGAGILSLTAARAGAAVLGSDVDEEIVSWARLNAAINGVEARFVVGDLLAAAPAEARFDVVAFNAPMLRSTVPMADAAPRYVWSPRGEALAAAFLDGVGAYLAPGGRVLLHSQLTPAVLAALERQAERARVLSVIFTHFVDGTAMALTEIVTGDGTGWRSVQVPLSTACAHLSRAMLDALAAPRGLQDDVTPRPAPWLELRTTERFDGGRRIIERRFGGVLVGDEDVGLLERLRGERLGALALSTSERERLEGFVTRGLAILA
jgi:SAM-dependent methyltransferase